MQTELRSRKRSDNSQQTFETFVEDNQEQEPLIQNEENKLFDEDNDFKFQKAEANSVFCQFLIALQEYIKGFTDVILSNFAKQQPFILSEDMILKKEELKIKMLKTPYDSTNQEHENLLEKYWNICTNNQPYERISKNWSQLGFQGTNPDSDFRAIGISGLKTLIYFGENYPNTFSKMLNFKSDLEFGTYPFSITGFNIIMVLLEYCGLGRKEHTENIKIHISNLLFSGKEEIEEEKETILIDFEEDKKIIKKELFPELFVTGMFILHNFWDTKKATYMDFPVILEETTKELKNQILNFNNLEDVINFNTIKENDL